MSAASSRREALTSVVLALGFSGGTLSVAAELLKHEVKEYWEACLGKRKESWGPYLGLGAMIPFFFSVLVGVTRSRKAMKDTFTSRLFCPHRSTRSFRLQLFLPLLFSFLLLILSLYILYNHGKKDLENQKCRGSLEEMKEHNEELSNGVYSLGGGIGFLASCSAAAFFVIHDVRKRRKEKMRRYYSSRYHADTTDDGTTDENAEEYPQERRRRGRSSGSSSRRHTEFLTSSRSQGEDYDDLEDPRERRSRSGRHRSREDSESRRERRKSRNAVTPQ